MPEVELQRRLAFSLTSQTTHSLLTKPYIQMRIGELHIKAGEQIEFQAPNVMRTWVEMMKADPNDLVSIQIGACRRCHGTENFFQWRGQAEFREAYPEWDDLPERKRKLILPPSHVGGYAYSWQRSPNPNCSICDGCGEPNAVFEDSGKA